VVLGCREQESMAAGSRSSWLLGVGVVSAARDGVIGFEV
jgi:hypothetical protein